MLWTILSVLIPLFIFGLYFWGAVKSELNDQEWVQREKEYKIDNGRDTIP